MIEAVGFELRDGKLRFFFGYCVSWVWIGLSWFLFCGGRRKSGRKCLLRDF